jgi:hypothetical protein
MKHQYFGDIRDLFKFDLLESLTKDLSLSGITYVIMLTKDEGDGKEKNDGNKRNYEKPTVGDKNTHLCNFLKQYRDKNEKKRNVTEIKEHFNKKKINIKCFIEDFKHNEREAYFSKILKSGIYINNRLIFFDPDNGLEIKKSNHKHVKFSELRMFYDAMGEKSIIAVIQFKPRENWKEKSLPNKLTKFKENFRPDLPYVTCIDSQGMAFFIITKTEERSIEVQISLNKYKSDYSSYPNVSIAAPSGKLAEQ